MASFDEIAQKYAQQIRHAVIHSELNESATTPLIKQAFVKKDPFVEALKGVNSDLSSLVYSDSQKPLSIEDKEDIIVRTGRELGLREPHDLIPLIKESSNENALAMLTYMSQVLRDLRK